jgi:hypothetical protein
VREPEQADSVLASGLPAITLFVLVPPVSASRKKGVRELGVVALAAVLSLGSVESLAQVYSTQVRPLGISYRVAQTDHFDLIYQDGFQIEAAEVGAVLEKSLARAKELIGVRRRFRVPVVLDAYNDRSNGFVSAFPFRMDLEIPPIRGNGLSPRHPSWLNTVSRHELVHAAHAEFGSGFGLVGLVRLLSPDMARSLNLMVPAGISEGVAVHLESEGEHAPGRMNHPFFKMEFRAAIAQKRPWSLSQMLERPQYSVPGDRFYHGGSYLFDYLYERDGGETFRRAQRFHYVMPLLGYGVSMWYGARRPPWRLGRAFRLDMRQEELERQVRLGVTTSTSVVAGGRGAVHRRPQWVSDSEVVAYASGHYWRPGFYRFDVESGRRRLVSAERITEEAFFAVSPDRRSLTFSRYLTDRLVPGRRVSEAHVLDFQSGLARRLTRGGRVFTAAANRHGEVWASTVSGQFSRLVVVGESTESPAVPLWSRSAIKSIMWNPRGDSLAVLVNRHGYQGIALVHAVDGTYRVEPLALSADCSVLDMSWFPDGSRILFSADCKDVPNLYSLTLADGSVYRLTNALYGAFEGSVSPDGSRVAYIDYAHESWRLVIAAVERLAWKPEPTSTFGDVELFADPPVAESLVPDEVPTLTARPYRAFRYLAPRGLLPIFDYDTAPTGSGDVDLGFAAGLAVTGADPLQRWSYIAGGYYQANKFWGRASIQTGQSVLRPAISVYRDPSTRLALTPDGIRRLGWEEQGVRLWSTLPVTLSSNVYRSSLVLSLGGELSRARLFDEDGTALTDFSRRASLTPTAVLGVGLHATRRDLRASSGATIATTSIFDVWGDRSRRKAMLADLRLYSRSIPGTGGSISLIGGILWQNQPSVYNLDFFLPRGLENTLLGGGTFVKFGADIVQPVAYVDNGLLILPLFIKAIYVYGFAESVKSISSVTFDFDSVGGGLGIQLRVLHSLSLDMRVGGAYLPDEGRFETVLR